MIFQQRSREISQNLISMPPALNGQVPCQTRSSRILLPEDSGRRRDRKIRLPEIARCIKYFPAAAAAIGLGLSGLMIYLSNREAWIREGTPAKGYIAEDVTFNHAELNPELKNQ